jgi:hypothetical protein
MEALLKTDSPERRSVQRVSLCSNKLSEPYDDENLYYNRASVVEFRWLQAFLGQPHNINGYRGVLQAPGAPNNKSTSWQIRYSDASLRFRDFSLALSSLDLAMRQRGKGNGCRLQCGTPRREQLTKGKGGYRGKSVEQ